jgi:acetyl esterase/lipase
MNSLREKIGNVNSLDTTRFPENLKHEFQEISCMLSEIWMNITEPRFIEKLKSTSVKACSQKIIFEMLKNILNELEHIKNSNFEKRFVMLLEIQKAKLKYLHYFVKMVEIMPRKEPLQISDPNFAVWIPAMDAKKLSKRILNLKILNAAIFTTLVTKKTKFKLLVFLNFLYFFLLKESFALEFYEHFGIADNSRKKYVILQELWGCSYAREIVFLLNSYFPAIKSMFTLTIMSRHSSKIKIMAFFSGYLKSWMIEFIQNDPMKLLTYCKTDRIVLHFHGGGFITRSFLHQIYLREWSNSLNALVLSVDYSLSPEFKFPTALEECYDSYLWINKVIRISGLKVSIVLAGDSAGGNLAASVALKLIQLDQKPPSGILLIYPALRFYFDPKSLNESLLYSLNDFVLPPNLLATCLSAYLLEENLNGTDFIEISKHKSLNVLIEPFYADDDLLLRFPPTRIIVGDQDPLFADCFIFSNRLRALKRNSRLFVYEKMIHGFLLFSAKCR